MLRNKALFRVKPAFLNGDHIEFVAVEVVVLLQKFLLKLLQFFCTKMHDFEIDQSGFKFIEVQLFENFVVVSFCVDLEDVNSVQLIFSINFIKGMHCTSSIVTNC